MQQGLLQYLLGVYPYTLCTVYALCICAFADKGSANHALYALSP